MPCSSGVEINPQRKYKVLQLLGEGGFGKVAKCRNRDTNELVALKVLKKKVDYLFLEEVEMLGLIAALDPDTFNLIRFIEQIEYDGRHGLVFEMLDLSVHDQMEKQGQFSLNQIRPMAKQLLISLFGLKSIGVMHTDIKPDNIMLVDQEKQPFKIKLIDFGVAQQCDSVILGSILQPIAFRSPEVTLGLPLSETVDMWTLACCLLSWYLGGYGFGCYSEFDQLTKFIHFLGAPSDELLNEARYSHWYFVREDSKWRLMTPQEYEESSGETTDYNDELQGTNLEEVVKGYYDFETSPEFIDREAFHDLLKGMFQVDPLKRTTPAEALLHPFITMEHLPDERYTQEAHDLMRVAQTDHLPLQRENLKKAAQCEEEKRAAALEARKLAALELVPPLSQPAIPEDVGDIVRSAEQSTCEATAEETHSGQNCVLQSENTSGHEDEERAAAHRGSPASTEPRAEEGGITETPVPDGSEPAPRSRFIPRILRELWSRLCKATTTNKPVLRKPKWAKLPRVFRRRSAGEQADNA